MRIDTVGGGRHPHPRTRLLTRRERVSAEHPPVRHVRLGRRARAIVRREHARRLLVRATLGVFLIRLPGR